MVKGRRCRSVQFSLGSEGAVYSPPSRWALEKALMDMPLEAVTFLISKHPKLTQIVFFFYVEFYLIKETESFYK